MRRLNGQSGGTQYISWVDDGIFVKKDTKKETVDLTVTFLKLNWYTLHFPFPQGLFHGQC